MATKISDPKGDVRYKPRDGYDWLVAREGQLLLPGDQVKTATGATVTVRYVRPTGELEHEYPLTEGSLLEITEPEEARKRREAKEAEAKPTWGDVMGKLGD